MLKQSDSRILPQARHPGMTLLVGLILCAAVVDTQRILHTLQSNVRRDVTNQVAVIAERAYAYLTCSMDGGSIQWLFQNGTTVPVFQPFTQFHTRQGVVFDRTLQVQYLAISPFAPTDQGFYRCLSVKNGLSQEVHVGLFLGNGLAPRDVSVTNATTDGFMVHWRAPAVGVGPMDGFLVQASRQDTKQVVESVSLAVGDRDYRFICLQPNSTFTVTVSAVYGTVVRSFSPLPEVKTTAGVWPEMCSTSDSSSDIVLPPDEVSSYPLPQPGTVRVTWTQAPNSTHGLTLVGYSVLYREEGGDIYQAQQVTDILSPGELETFQLEGLELGTTYELRVAVVTTSGVGKYSDVINVTTYADCCSECSSIQSTVFVSFEVDMMKVDESDTLVHIDVFRYGPMSAPITLRVTDIPLTAKRVKDYSLQSSSLVFLNTERMVERSTVVVRIREDSTPEQDPPTESFRLVLSSSAAGGGMQPAVVFSVPEMEVHIRDNDY